MSAAVGEDDRLRLHLRDVIEPMTGKQAEKLTPKKGQFSSSFTCARTL